jgi:hypothetical protein
MKLIRLKKRVNALKTAVITKIIYTFYTLTLFLMVARPQDEPYFGGALPTILLARAQLIELTLPEFGEAEMGGSPVLGYDVQIDDGHYGEYRFILGGDRNANTLATSVVLTAKDDGIEVGLTYRVRYRAINAIGEGEWSDVAYIRAATLPLPPPSPIVTSHDATQITLELSQTSNDGGSIGGSAFWYNLHVNEGEDDSEFHKITAYDGSALTYTALVGDAIGTAGVVFEEGKTYTFKLTAENEVGDSELRYQAPTTRVAMGGLPNTPV